MKCIIISAVSLLYLVGCHVQSQSLPECHPVLDTCEDSPEETHETGRSGEESSVGSRRPVDVIFVIDNSRNMEEYTFALSQKVEYFFNLASNLNVQLAITTTTVEIDVGRTPYLDPGEAGMFIGPPLRMDSSINLSEVFKRELLCKATPWAREDLTNQPDNTCGEGISEATIEYLECLCGNSNWDRNSGSGHEEPLEATLLALCRSVETPPEFCYENPSLFTEEDEWLNGEFLREESSVVVILFGDEGDHSRRLRPSDQLGIYQEAFQSFGRDIYFISAGLRYDAETDQIFCNDKHAIPTRSVSRLQLLSESTGGFVFPLKVQDTTGVCQLNDFGNLFTQIVELLRDI